MKTSFFSFARAEITIIFIGKALNQSKRGSLMGQFPILFSFSLSFTFNGIPSEESCVEGAVTSIFLLFFRRKVDYYVCKHVFCVEYWNIRKL